VAIENGDPFGNILTCAVQHQQEVLSGKKGLDEIRKGVNGNMML